MIVGRETSSKNDLFFVCSLIDYIARKTTNKRKDVVRALGIDKIRHLFDFADVYHCENIDKIADQLIEESQLKIGTFDNVRDCRYAVPRFWDIGRIYQRLISKISEEERQDPINVLMNVYCSWISDKIDNYNSSMYYSSPAYLYACWKEGTVLAD